MKYGDAIEFVYIDREAPENQAIVKRYGVRSQPIFIFLDANGNILKRFDGPVPEETLVEAIEMALATTQ